MLATGVMSVFGFIFWIICSRLYTSSEIGLATSLISTSSILIALSLFGLNNTLIRFLSNHSDRHGLVSTVLIIASFGGISTSALFLIWAYVTHNPIIQLGAPSIIAPVFITFIFLQATGIIFDSVFIAHRSAKYILFKNSLFSVTKLALPFLFFSLGAIGIIYSITVATLLAWMAGLVWLTTLTNFKFKFPDSRVMAGMRRFATGNYLGNIFGMLPTSLLPLIIISRLGPQEAAYFYMPMMIITLINAVPSANAQSLFAEAANDEENLLIHLRKAFRHLFLLLIPIVVAVEILGYSILSFFGHEYAEIGTQALQILAVASIVGSLNYFGDTILNITKRSGLYITMNAFNALLIIILSYYSAPYGLTAIAMAWFVAQITTMMIYLVINRRLVTEFLKSSTKTL